MILLLYALGVAALAAAGIAIGLKVAGRMTRWTDGMASGAEPRSEADETGGDDE
jgi:hypothetical protein